MFSALRSLVRRCPGWAAGAIGIAFLVLVSPFSSAFSQVNLLAQKDGAVLDDRLGWSVAGAGDVNGDGVADYIVGAPYTDPGGVATAGSAFVYSGTSNALLYQKDGVTAGDRFGTAVAGAGDLNGDGRADFIVGSLSTAFVYSGATGTLLYQKTGGSAVAGAGDLDGDGRADFIVGVAGADPSGVTDAGSVFVYSGATGNLLYQKNGVASGDNFGAAVAGVGDLNGDGRADFIVGAPGFDPGGLFNAGSAFVYSGATGALLYQKNGAASVDLFGNGVAGAGDVSGDGRADFIIGARLADVGGLTDAGSAFVYSGATGALLYQKNGSAVGQGLGRSVAGAGDVNADARADFIIGASDASPGGLTNAGSAWVFSGITGALLYQKDGAAAYDNLGFSVAGAGDVSGDGIADFLIGVPFADPGGRFDAGSALVYGFTTTPPPSAVISLSPTSFSFSAVQSGSLPPSQSLQITNSGGGSLNWSVVKAGNSSWLSATPASGTAPSTVVVSITTTGLAPSTYYDTLVISGNASNSPQRVPVTYTVSAPPSPAVISLSPTAFAFTAVQNGSLPASQSLQITNSGGGSLNWSVAKARNSSWLSASPASGTAPSTVVVSITTTGLAPGSYNDTLVVSGNASNSPQRVPVSYTVSAPPTPAVISLSPSSFAFTAVQNGSLPSSQNLQITNSGGGSLNWSVVKARNSSWLSASPASGTAPSTVVVSITTTGLAPGSYNDTLVVSGNASNSPQRVPVSYAVSAPPTPAVISLSPTSFAFTAVQNGSLPSSQNLQITNSGGGSLNWSVVKARNSSWLSASPASGTAPSTVVVSITTTGLAPGSYNDTLVVSGNASNSPQRVPVTYTVSAAPSLKGQITQSTATCGSFVSGTSSDLTQVCYVVKNGKISNPDPNVFYYYSQVRAASASFAIDIVQTNNNAAFPFFGVVRNGVALYDANCTKIGAGTSPSPGQAQVNVTGATVGQLYVISVKYSTNAVAGSPVGLGHPIVHYDYATRVNGVEVTRDPDGSNLAACATPTSVAGTNDVPTLIALQGNHPNPFNASTAIRFSLQQDAHVRLDIYNLLGQKVVTLVDEPRTAGEQTVVWDGKDALGSTVASGVYFYRIAAENHFEVGRMTLLK